MRVLLLSLALLILLSLPAAAAPNPPIDLRTVFAALQPNDCTVDPSLCDDHETCTTDFCMSGSCVHSNLPENSPCSDGSACTTDDVCKTGRCTGTAISCDDGNLCTADTCNPATGACTHAFACDDGLACTLDSCEAGTGTCNFVPVEGSFGVPDVLIFTAETGIKLSWGATGAEHYEVHRSTNPFFTPGISTLAGTFTEPPFVFTDPGVLDDARTNNDYGVLAVCFNYSKRSRTVGEFGYTVEKGK